MPEESPEFRAQTPARKWPLPSWRKISEFVLSVISLERSVSNLTTRNARLEEEIARIQRQTDEQSGQLKVLIGFVQTSLRDQVETSAERALTRMLQRLGSPDAEPSDSER